LEIIKMSETSNLERRQFLLQRLSKTHRLSVSEICEQFTISEATARRDIDALAQEGKLQRFHGGVLAVEQAAPEAPALGRSREQTEEKERIGQAAAALVQDHETVFLGSGTTVLQAARHLAGRPLTVITNSLPVIHLLADDPAIQLISLGGVFRLSERSFIGHIAETVLADLRADKVLIGIRAISLQHGLTNDYLPETMTDRTILKMGREVIVLADHTKFGRVSTVHVAPVEKANTIVTDSATDAEMIVLLREKNIRVIIA
jgi:DeoR family transcriptional regulator, aga operon transcriptional repressor